VADWLRRVRPPTLIVRSRILAEDQTSWTTGFARMCSAKCAVPYLLAAGRYALHLGEQAGKVTVALESDRVTSDDVLQPRSAVNKRVIDGAVIERELETLFWAIDYSGIEEIYFSGVWSAGP
jgi:hypothetical protein